MASRIALHSWMRNGVQVTRYWIRGSRKLAQANWFDCPLSAISVASSIETRPSNSSNANQKSRTPPGDMIVSQLPPRL